MDIEKIKLKIDKYITTLTNKEQEILLTNSSLYNYLCYTYEDLIKLYSYATLQEEKKSVFEEKEVDFLKKSMMDNVHQYKFKIFFFEEKYFLLRRHPEAIEKIKNLENKYLNLLKTKIIKFNLLNKTN